MEDSKIKKLWDEFHVPRNIQRHMEAVAKITIRLGKRLIDRGEVLNLRILRQAALLHDLAKAITVFDKPGFKSEDPKIEDIQAWNNLKDYYKEMTDSEITALVLRDIGELEMADIVRKHHFTSVIEEGNEPKTIAEKLLYYADKLVLHDREVSLEERLKDFNERYGGDERMPDKIKQARKAAREIEKEMKTKLE